MKKSNKVIIYLLLTVAFAVTACSPKIHSSAEATTNKAMQVVEVLHNPSSNYVVVVSHRGDWRNYPENSIPAIESVIRMDVDVMELDLKMTKDSILVLCHDWTLDRTTTGSGPVNEKTYAEILKYDLKRGHGISIPGLKMPTLKQALQVCKDRIVVNVDQGYDYYDQVLAITEELGMTDQVLIKSGRSLNEVQEKMSSYTHNMMYMPVIGVDERAKMNLFDGYINSKPSQLAYEICFAKLDENVQKVAKEVLASGSKLWVNTIWGSLCGDYDDDRAFESATPDEVYAPILHLGTSIIQTDRPQFIIQYLKEKGRRNIRK